MKLRYTFLLLFSVLCHIFTFAQEHELEWVFALKETYDRSFPPQYGCDIEMTSGGDIIVVGTVGDTIDFDPSPAVYLGHAPNKIAYGIMARYTSSGSFVWQKTLYSRDDDKFHLTEVDVDSQDNLYIAGYFYECADFDPSPAKEELCGVRFNFTYSPYVAKYDANGNYLWAFAALDAINGGTSMSYDMHVDETHNAVYLISHFRDSVLVNQQYHFSNGGYDLVIIKLDLDGNYQWSRQIGGVGDEYLSDIATDQEGNLLFTGHFQDTVDFDPSPATFNLSCPVPANSNLFFAKFDATGQFVWAKSLSSSDEQKRGGVIQRSDLVRASLKLDEQNNIFLASRFDGTVDLDPGPGTEALSSSGLYDFFLARYSPSGDLYWKKQIHSQNWVIEEFASVVNMELYQDNIYLVGTTDDTMDFDLETVHGRYESLKASGFIASYNKEGAYRWTRINLANEFRFHEGYLGSIRSVCFDGDGSMYATGQIGGIVDFDDDGDSLTNRLEGLEDMFVVKYGDTTTTIPDGINDLGNQEAAFDLYPNPASEQLLISFPDGRNRQLEITDAVGRIMLSQRINQPAFKLDVSEYPEGLYFVRISDGEVVGVRKLVVR